MSFKIKFYNTLSRALEPFEPLSSATAQQDGKQGVKMYVCGPTVYDESHLGHARCYISWDVLYRFLTFAGYDVTYIRNITDVDDKILNRAKEKGEKPEALAQHNTVRFHQMMTALNVLNPSDKNPEHEPKATAHIPSMLNIINELIKKNAAYLGRSKTVYFDISKKADYGALVNQSLDDLQSGARVEVTGEKRNPLDFALWKPADKKDPLVWQTPWDKTWGRPGWHIECSAMAYSLLGEQIDIHAGGMDLIFPHHQNEIAQSESFTGKPYVKYWLHNGFVNVKGEKMSKSLGNFFTIDKLLQTYDANTIRYFLLTHHYRSPVDFSDEALEGARNRVQKIQENLSDLAQSLRFEPETLIEKAKEHLTSLRLRSDGGEINAVDSAILLFIRAMSDDLNTAQALAALNDLLTRSNILLSSKSGEITLSEAVPLGAFLALSEVLGFDFKLSTSGPTIEALRDDLILILGLSRELKFDEVIQGVGTSSARENFIEIDANRTTLELLNDVFHERLMLKSYKKWEASDLIRNRLAEIGITIKDSKDKDALPLWQYEPKTLTRSDATAAAS